MPDITELKNQLRRVIDESLARSDSGETDHLNEAELKARALHKQIGDLERNEAIRSIGATSEGWSPETDQAPGLAAQVKAAEWHRTSKPEVAMGSALRFKTSSFPGDSADELPSVRGPFAGLSRDVRYIYPRLQAGSLGENLAVNEYVETSPPSVSGNVVRDPLDATNSKATVEVTFDFQAEAAKQLAVVLEDVPNAIIDSFAGFSGLLNDRMQRELDEAADQHVIDQIDSASPDSGSSGATLVEQLRAGVSAMRSGGVNPTIAAMSPVDAALLDLTTVGADGLYLFAVRATGSSSPLWGLSIVEAKNVDAGSIYLIDPNVLGVFYTGPSKFLSDPYSGMSNNLTSLRLEQTALFHVRNVQGAYIVTSGS